MNKYTPPACRILVTRENRQDLLLRYDPTKGDGPWWHDTTDNSHWWNGEFCLEILLERDVPLTEMEQLEFTGHHDQRCSIEPNGKCRDAGTKGEAASAELLAAWAAGPLAGKCRFPQSAHSGAKNAWKELKDSLPTHEVEQTNGVSAANRMAGVLARALLSAIARRDEEEQEWIVQQFKTRRDMRQALANVVADAVGMKVSEFKV